jgi:prolyl-tRNA editing enzyme YbaK/EbsC (Cys-tRNA(Pro) deacylase)
MSNALSKNAARFKAALESNGFVVDITKIEAAMGLPLAQADGAFVKKRTGYAIGGLPPAGHREALQTFLDVDLKQYGEIWAAAGTPFAVFRLTPADLPAMTGGKWLDVAEC